jgi:hypothetical protein
MTDVSKRLADRFRQAGDVVPFGGKPKKPTGPTQTINGQKFVLSDWWSMMDHVQETGEGGAKLIDTGGNRFRYLWVFDTERRIVAMWRHSDGDDKYHASENSSMHEIITLDKRGQLNRVDHATFLRIEKEMKRRADDTLKALKQWAAENQSDLEKTAAKILDDWFKKNVEPSLERRIRDLDSGVKPLGFKYRPESPRSERLQAIHFLLGKALEGFTQDEAYKVVGKVVGYDPYDPPEGADPQAVQWAFHDFTERLYDSYE